MTVYRKDYQRPLFTTKTFSLDISLNPTTTVVESTLKIEKCAQHNEPLVLDGKELCLKDLHLNGQEIPKTQYTLASEKLIIRDLPDHFTLFTRVIIHPSENQTLMGLYQSKRMLCTQCEPHGMQRITYCQDRPDVLSVFTTTLRADKHDYPSMLSNGNCISDSIENNQRVVIWHDPHPKPTYLFAIVAGTFDKLSDTFTTLSGKVVDIHLYVDTGKKEQGQFALEAIKRSMAWDEKRYGREYDLDLFMVVSCHDFNSGAMENKGLNIFNSRYVLAHPSTATDQDLLNVDSVIAHEYCHNWSGNRVTCRDWFQLSLKEGLTVFRDQNYSMDHIDPVTCRIDDVNILRIAQFREDAGPMSHPVRPEKYESMKNFYTATVYNKGAEVIRMLETLVGVEQFRQALDLYFERFDGQAVTVDDLLSVFSESCGINLEQFRLWYSQSGTPHLTVRSEYNAKDKTLVCTLSQHTPKTADQNQKHPLHIPCRLGFLDSHGAPLPVKFSGTVATSHLISLTQETHSFPFTEVTENPVISVNQGFSSPVKRDIDTHDSLFLYQHDFDAFNRWDHGQHVMEDFIIQAYNERLTEEKLTLLREGCRSVLIDPQLSAMQKAQMLSLPRVSMLLQKITQVDPVRLEQKYVKFEKELMSPLADLFKQTYHEVYALRDGLKPDNIGYRRLMNLCLKYLVNASTQYVSLAEKQFHENLDQMTCLIGSLNALSAHNIAEREKLMQQFKHKFKHDALIMDKWFALSAMLENENPADYLHQLEQDSLYQPNNPNCIRALWLTFAHANIKGFHAPDGSGYQALQELVSYWDNRNPQLAAQLCQPLIHWEMYAPHCSKKMLTQLHILASKAKSKNIKELVGKAVPKTKA